MKDRLSELDGLRAVAILLVIGFHYFARFPNFYPYPPSSFPIFTFGALGVHLFFIISGFVIAMTLLNCASVWEFAVRRFSRLWPPMVLCSALTFVVLWNIDNPFTLVRRTSLAAFLPSLTFTEPLFWKWLSPRIDYIDGVYWSLFVEVRFYFWAAILFFLFGARGFCLRFSLFAFAVWSICMLSRSIGLGTTTTILNIAFFPEYIPLFGAGVLFFELFRGNRAPWLLVALGGFFALEVLTNYLVSQALFIAVFFLVFLALVYRRQWLKPLSHPALGWIGLTSYSTYLLHQNIGLSIVANFNSGLPRYLLYAMTITTILGILTTASLVYLTVERHSSKISRLILAGMQ